MPRRAATLLELVESVIIDASWTAHQRWAAAAAMAREVTADMVQLHCAAPPGLTTQRTDAKSGDASDANPAIATRMAAAQDPWPEAITIDTSGTGSPGSLTEMTGPAQRALQAIRPHGSENVWRPIRRYMLPD